MDIDLSLRPSDVGRFIRKIDVDVKSGCWNWVAGKHIGNRYGHFWLNRRFELAHRVSYVMFVSTDIKGMHVLHKCDNSLCVNPNHLFLGTHADNMRDKSNKGRAYNGYRKGEAQPSSKLTEDDVVKIRILLKTGRFTIKSIAEEFNVVGQTVSDIKTGKTWSHI